MSYSRLSHDQVIATLRAISDASASAMVTKYIKDANQWTDNATAVAATNSEYSRIRTSLEEQLATGNFALLKRVIPNELSTRNSKKIKISKLDTSTELTGGNLNGFYAVCGGTLYSTHTYDGNARAMSTAQSVEPQTSFNFDTLVKRAPANAGTAALPGLLTDPYRRQIQLKQHMTSIGQAFIHAETGKSTQAVFSDDHLQDWASSRHLRTPDELKTEFVDTAALVARVMTYKSKHSWYMHISGSCKQFESENDNEYTLKIGSLDFKITYDADNTLRITKSSVACVVVQGQATALFTISNSPTRHGNASDMRLYSCGDTMIFKVYESSRSEAWFSSNVYRNVIEALDTEQSTATCQLTDSMGTYVNEQLHNQESSQFERAVAKDNYDAMFKDGKMLVLTPVPPDEIATAKQKAMTVRFGTCVLEQNTYQWCIGSSPTPSLDAVEAAITCLQSKLNIA